MKVVMLLRGINVGGKNSLKMADLRGMLESKGCREVETYLQSGNVIFETDEMAIQKLEKTIIETIRERFDLSINILLISEAEWINLVRNNPLAAEYPDALDKLHVTLFKDKPEQAALSKAEFKKEENEKFVMSDKAVYLYCPDGYGRTKLTNSVFEAKLKVSATTRNWNTMRKLAEMLNGK